MTKQPMFTPNGDGFDISPAGVFLLCAATVFGDPSESTPAGIANARTLMNSVMAAARDGGYLTGALETMFACRQRGCRVMEMAQAAVDAAGPSAMATILRNAGLGRK